MRALITGANGQLGRSLSLIFKDSILASSSELNIASIEDVKKFESAKIDAIINAAAYTKVDDAEKPENLSLAWYVNSQGVANLAQLAAKLNVPLVHISSDYVFDGSKKEAYTESDLFSPLGVYGASKAAGDLAAMRYPKSYIFRTSWVIGDGNNFVRIMANLAQKGVNPAVVDDQFGRLTFSDTLAEAIHFALTKNIEFGTYNLTNSGDVVSWFDLARDVFKLSGADPERISPTSTEEYFKDKDIFSPRPKNSELSLAKIEASGFKPEDWRSRLSNYINGESDKL
jgi:dTDP-4-dehydrorhamnose reductase